jgi:hypothetical protein
VSIDYHWGNVRNSSKRRFAGLMAGLLVHPMRDRTNGGLFVSAARDDGTPFRSKPN